jgi:hypothetical protein
MYTCYLSGQPAGVLDHSAEVHRDQLHSFVLTLGQQHSTHKWLKHREHLMRGEEASGRGEFGQNKKDDFKGSCLSVSTSGPKQNKMF